MGGPKATRLVRGKLFLRYCTMRVFLLAACVSVTLSLRAPVQSGLLRPRHIETETDAPSQWFDNQVDHFDDNNNATYKQQYFVNDTLFAQGQGHVFMLLGGEGPIAPKDVNGHFIINLLAEEYKALVVSVEHRFYGASLPAKDLSTENLKLLSAQQALADYNQFAKYLRTQYITSANQKLVTFGGSYSGALSAWMREFYPDNIDVAYGTSGPVLAQLDFNTYYETVTDVIGPQCAARINETTQELQTMLLTANGTQQVQQMFNTCTQFGGEDRANFMNNIFGNVAGIVQYNLDNVDYFPFNVTVMCDYITDSSKNAVEAFANFNSKYNAGACQDISYAAFVEQMKNTYPQANNSNAAGRAWTYQTCTEFGYYQTAEGKTVFPKDAMSLLWNLEVCKDVFNIIPSENTIDATNHRFGGVHLNATKVIIPNGSGDPWHNLGIINSHPSLDQGAVFMTGTAHCADLYQPSPNDLDSLTQGRKEAHAFLAKYLAM